MKALALLFFTLLLLPGSPSLATRTQPNPPKSKPTSTKVGENTGNDFGMGGYFGPGSGFDIPGFGGDWGHGIAGGGYGSGYGGPNGGYSKGGIVRPTVVCKEKGPCYKKKLRCPAKCFSAYSRSGKGYGGGGGGGGGCTMDCKKKCVAYC